MLEMRFSYLVDTMARRDRQYNKLVKFQNKRDKIREMFLLESDAPELRYFNDKVAEAADAFILLGAQVEGMTTLMMIPEFVSYIEAEYGLPGLWSQEQLELTNRLHTAARIINRRYNGNAPEDVMERLVEWVTGMPVDKGEDMMTLTRAN